MNKLIWYTYKLKKYRVVKLFASNNIILKSMFFLNKTKRKCKNKKEQGYNHSEKQSDRAKVMYSGNQRSLNTLSAN